MLTANAKSYKPWGRVSQIEPARHLAFSIDGADLESVRSLIHAADDEEGYVDFLIMRPGSPDGSGITIPNMIVLKRGALIARAHGEVRFKWIGKGLMADAEEEHREWYRKVKAFEPLPKA